MTHQNTPDLSAGGISPATKYCYNKYGNYRTVKTRNGEMGVVELPDGKLYDEWYIYHKEVVSVQRHDLEPEIKAVVDALLTESSDIKTEQRHRKQRPILWSALDRLIGKYNRLRN